MSYGRNFSSSQQLSRDNQDSSNSTNSAQSEQGSFRSSSFGGGWGRPSSDSRSQASSGGGGWGRPNSDSRPQASGGGGWGRPQHAPAATSSGWGRSSFQRSPAAASGGWGRSPASEEASIQPPQQPQQPQLEQETSEQTAPPEGYDYEFLMFSFNKKFEIPKDLSQDELPILDRVVQTYITSTPLRYGQPLKAAVDRALLKIHEELQSKLRRTIPEKDSNPRGLTMQEEFVQELTKTLSSYGLTSLEHVNRFVAEYMSKPFSQLEFPGSLDKDTGRPLCLRPSEAFTKQHMDHAINSYFKSLNLESILHDKFGFVDGMMLDSEYRQLPSSFRKMSNLARSDDGRIVNGFVMVVPPNFGSLRRKLEDALITSSCQSYSVHVVSLTSSVPPNTGDICLVIPAEIYTQTKSDKEMSKDRIMTKKPGMSQYRTTGPKGCILLGMGQVIEWKQHGIQCTFNGSNMRLYMEQFCTILCTHSGAIPLFVKGDSKMTISKEQPEDDHSPIHREHSSAGGGWGAAAPK